MSDFWSRRRAAVAAEDAAEQAALATGEQAERDAALAEKSDEELLAELDLPDPDTLGEGDDFRAFLTDAVPARLKTRALRRLWRVNPVLANLDGLIDYGEDFTDSATVIENLQTAYQVGKGMLAHLEKMARDEQDEAPQPEDLPREDAPTEAEQEPETEPVPAIVASAAAEPAPDPVAMPQRRMQFTFEERQA